MCALKVLHIEKCVRERVVPPAASELGAVPIPRKKCGERMRKAMDGTVSDEK